MELKYSYTDKIVKYLEAIAEAKGIIENAVILPVFEMRLRREARIRSTHASTHIEGNELTENQVEAVLDGEEVIARERDKKEVENYARVLDFISEVYRGEDLKITEAVIRQIHKITLEGIQDHYAGAYRTVQNYVKNALTGEIIYTPPSPNEVPMLMREFTEWLEGDSRTISPVIVAGIAHHELVWIHPFTDGNGRSARALATLILYCRGYDIRRLIALEDYSDKNLEKYYECIREADRTGDLTVWLEFFTEGLAIELNRVKEKILAYSRDKILQQRIGQVEIHRQRQWKCIDYVAKEGSITVKEYLELLGNSISERTARRDLSELVEKGLFEARGKGPSTRYRFST